MIHTSFAAGGLRLLLLPMLLALTAAPMAGCGPDKGGDDAKAADANVDGASGDASDDAMASDAEAHDTSSSDDTTAATDTGETCNGEMGCPCSSSTDCNASLCVDTPDGKRCSKYCGDGSCPTGWACAGDTGAGDPLSFCVIDGGVLCRPCTNDGACTASGFSGARCVNYGAAGSFCGLPCQSDAGCPSGRVCKDVKSIDGLSTKQCVVPGDGPGAFGACTCSAADVATAASTTCKVDVGSGADAKTCAGSRSCGADGLGACVALQGDAAKCEQTQCLDPVTLTPLADGKPCDDGRVCTTNDTCQKGLCVSGKSVCPCEPGFQDCEASSGSANLCVGPPICTKQPDGAQVPYQCKPNPGLTKVCDASLDTTCSKNACVPLSGSCTVTAVEATKEICDVPATTPGAEPTCRREVLPAGADPQPPTPCDDGLPCSKGDACSGGSCVPATTTACKCTQDADCIDDGDLCNGTPFCDKSGTTWSCKANPATIVACDTSTDTTCLVTTCEPTTGSCAKAPMPIGFPCSDGVACTSGDICAPNGTCASGSWVCCTTDGDCINPGSKFYADDGNLCNGVPYCNKQSGACELNPGSVVTCPSVDDTACRHNLCDPKTGTCGLVLANAASKTACDDGDACTGSDTCLDGGVCGSSTFVCPCTTDVDCVAKDDGNLCNGTLYCDPNDNHCKPNPATVVSCQTVDDTPCTQTTCQPKTGACKAVDLPEKTTCDADGSYCTSGDHCDGKGSCKAGAAICQCEKDADCATHEDGNLCNGTLYCDKTDPKAPVCKLNAKTVVSCPSVDDTACNQNLCQPTTGQCVKTNSKIGAPCDDGEPCTGGDGCNGKGICSPGIGKPCACADDAACAKFDDGDACNGAYGCQAKSCVYQAKPPSCDDGNSCTDDSCDKQKGCVHANNTTPCQDGLACTTADVCKDGSCVAGPTVVGGQSWALPGLEAVNVASVLPLPDGQLVLVGGGTNQAGVNPSAGGFIVRVNAQQALAGGGLVASGDAVSTLNAAAPVSEALGVAVGSSGDSAATDRAWAVVFDSTAKVLSQVAMPKTSTRSTFGAVGSGSDGTVIAAGMTWGPSNGKTGDLLLTRLLVGTKGATVGLGPQRVVVEAAYDRGAMGILVRADGSAIVAGRKGPGATGWGFLLDVDANLQPRRPPFELQQPSGGFELRSVVPRDDGGVWVLGQWNAGSDPLAPGFTALPSVLLFQADGALAFQRKLTAGNVGFRTFAHGAANDGHDGLVITGARVPDGKGYAAKDLWIGRVDAHGQLLCDAVVEAAGIQAGYGIAMQGDTIVAAGSDEGKAHVVRANSFCQASCSAAGSCATVAAKTCDDGNPCTLDGCKAAEGTCSHANQSETACADGVPCHATGACQAGSCKASAVMAQLSDDTAEGSLTDLIALGDGELLAVGTLHTAGKGDQFRVQWLRGDGTARWDKTYGDAALLDNASGGARTAAGGAIVVGRRTYTASKVLGLAVVVDADGNQTKLAEVGAASGVQTLDSVVEAGLGRHIAIGRTNVGTSGSDHDAWLVILGDDLKPVSNLRFGGPMDDHFDAVTVGGNDVTIAGVTRRTNNQPALWLVQTDLNGNLRWQRDLGQISGMGVGMAQDDQGYLLLATENSLGKQEDLRLVRTDRGGAIVWARTLAETTAEFASAVTRAGTGWVTTSYQKMASDTWQSTLTAFDASGNVQWKHALANSGDSFAFTVTADDRGLVVGGKRASGTAYRPWLLRTDAFGNESCDAKGCGTKQVETKGPLGCDDGDPCTLDGCTDASGCSHTKLSDGAACDDGALCTAVDACSKGVCVGCASTWESKIASGSGADIVVNRAFALDDGTSVMVGDHSADGWFSHLDGCGATLASGAIGDSSADTLDDGVQASDGKVWLVGTTNRNANQSGDGRVVRVEVTTVGGKATWTKKTDVTFGGTAYDTLTGAVRDDVGGVYAVGFRDTSALGGDAWLVHVDVGGNAVAAYDHNGAEPSAFSAIARGSNGALLAVGSIGAKGADAWIARMNDDGKSFSVAWTKRWTDANGADAFYGAAEHRGGWVASGAVATAAGIPNCRVVAVSSSGDQTWIRQLGGNAGTICYRVAARESGVLVVGRRDQTGSVLAWFAQLDGDGKEQWSATLPNPAIGSEHLLTGVVPLPGARWLLAGRSMVAGVAAGKRQAWAQAVDAWGQTSCSSNLCAGLPWSACDDGLSSTLDQCSASAGCVATKSP